MTSFIYTARRVEECVPWKVKDAAETVGVLYLDCSHCKERLLALKPMFEGATAAAEQAGLPLTILCRQCAETQTGLPLEVQDAAAAVGGGSALIAQLEPPKGGDA